MVEVGRPRTFHIEDVLDKALTVFWRKGYQGTSMTDLIEEMGINRSSIYAAFHSKEELFRQALDLYINRSALFMDEALSAPTIRQCAERLFYGIIQKHICSDSPRCCLIVQSVVTSGDETEPMRLALLDNRKLKEAQTAQRFGDLAQQRGQSVEDCPKLAKFVGTVIHGMAVHVAAGASIEDLYSIVEVALRAFPD